MRAVRLHADGLRIDEIPVPEPKAGEVLVRVCAAAITRDELTWPEVTRRLPAIPSYELSGVVAAVADGVAGSDVAVGDDVFALTPFDRDGAAAEYTVVPAAVLAPRPQRLTHAEGATLPLAGLTAWQGLFDHGRLSEGERVPSWVRVAASVTSPSSSPAVSWSATPSRAIWSSTPWAATRWPEPSAPAPASSPSPRRWTERPTSSWNRTGRNSSNSPDGPTPAN
jgi:hypothetical protein